jgi:hypothetical protein
MDAWISLFIQVPLVGVFVWYSLELTRRNQAAQDLRDKAYLEALEKISTKLEEHDACMQAAVSVMMDRTKRRPVKEKP